MWGSALITSLHGPFRYYFTGGFLEIKTQPGLFLYFKGNTHLEVDKQTVYKLHSQLFLKE